MTWRFALLVGTIVVSALFALTQFDLDWAWLNADLMVVTLVVANSTFALINGSGPLWREWTKAETIEAYAGPTVDLASFVLSTLDLDEATCSVSVFRVGWVWRWKRFPFCRRELIRALRGRSGGFPPYSSAVPWIQGRGAIGEAWRTQAPAYHYRPSDMGESKPTSRAIWKKQADRPLKLRLRHAQSVWRYCTVVASPLIVNDRRVVGCVSIATSDDVPHLIEQKAGWNTTETMLAYLAAAALDGKLQQPPKPQTPT